MARSPLNVRVPDFQPSERMPALQPLQEIQRPAGQADETIFQVSSKLSDAVGQVADDLAKNEGRKAGMIAGADPNFRPSENPTLRGRSYDAAATDVYLSKLQAQFQSDAVTTYERHKDDPAAFKNAMERLHTDYSNRHVWPEVRGYFDTVATKVATSLRQSVASNYDARRKDENRASLINGINTTDNNRSRLLAANPESPETEAAILKMRDENILRLQSEANAGTTTQEQAAKLIADERNKAWQDILLARAQRLGDPEQIATFREQVRVQYGAGKYDGFTGWETLDAKLVQYQNGVTTKRSAALKELNTQIGGFLDRFSDGRTPPVTEWMTLEQTAREAGPQGIAAFEQARAKLGLRIKLQSLPLDQAEAHMRDLERMAKATPAATNNAELFVMQRLMAGGLTQAQAAGVAGNLVHESGGRLNPNARNPRDGRDGSDSIGVGQWNSDRANRLKAFASQRGQNWNDLGTQIDFVLHELSTTESAAGQKLRMAKTVDEATAAFISYERPRGWTEANPRGGDQFAARLRHAARLGSSGVTGGDAELIKDGRAVVEARRTLIGSDPMLAAEREGRIKEIVPVDFGQPAADLARSIGSRVAQAEAVSEGYRRPAQYIRADERNAAKAILAQGGDKALDLISGVVQGAGGRAPAVLKEIADDAPAMAHAGQVLFQTGDRAFARQVAEAQKARAVPGAKPPTPAAGDMATAMRETMGSTAVTLDAASIERTQAAATLWAEHEFRRRNMDPKEGSSETLKILREAFRRARGMTGSGDNVFGGLAPFSAKVSGKLATVEAPPDVKPSMFQQVIGAIRNEDINSMPNPPVDPQGKTADAATLRRYHPFWTPNGYFFGAVDPATGVLNPLKSKDGSPFLLDFNSLRPTLRERVPGAFR